MTGPAARRLADNQRCLTFAFFSSSCSFLGAFFCALGVMHFLETYLASILYVALPFGIVTSRLIVHTFRASAWANNPK